MYRCECIFPEKYLHKPGNSKYVLCIGSYMQLVCVRLCVCVCVCVCVSGQSRPRPFMLIKASHWCVRGAGRLWLARSKPFIRWQPRHMNGCLLTCSKTIWSCQGSGGQRRKSAVCWCFFGEATGEVLWTQHSGDLLGEGSLSHSHTHTHTLSPRHARTLTHTRWEGEGREGVWRRGFGACWFFFFFFFFRL